MGGAMTRPVSTGPPADGLGTGASAVPVGSGTRGAPERCTDREVRGGGIIGGGITTLGGTSMCSRFWIHGVDGGRYGGGTRICDDEARATSDSADIAVRALLVDSCCRCGATGDGPGLGIGMAVVSAL
jgi:hypothetical protein